MLAEKRPWRFCLPLALIAPSGIVHAQASAPPAPPPPPPPSPIEYTLTEAGAPKAKPWESPALLSATIDRNGRDFFEVHLNGEVQIRMSEIAGNGHIRTLQLAPTASWDRSSRPGKQQDELKIGLATRFFDDVDIRTVDPNSNPLFYSLSANVNYARTGVYPNLNAAPCNTTPASPLCRKQFNESVRGSLSLFPYFATFEDVTANGRLAYSIRPQLQIAHDQIIDGTLNATTLQRITGGYSSAMVGLGIQLRPRFISPQFEFNLTGQLRQRLSASAARAPLIERTAERMEASLTYYLTREDNDPQTRDWRVGLSVVWTEGSDPFENKPEASTIVFALRIGRL